MTPPTRSEAYAFEDDAKKREAPQTGERIVSRHRAWTSALEQAEVLLRRLEVPEPLIARALGESRDPAALAELGPRGPAQLRELRSLLAQYASDVIMNAGWYQAKVREFERRLRTFQALAVVCALIILGLFGKLAMDAPPPDTVDSSTTWIAQLSLFGTLFFGLLKTLAMGTNLKRQLTAFWEAGADLKEALYTFEHAWKGKLETLPDLLGPDFATALYEELRNARTIVRKERAAFFEAYASPEEILAVPQSMMSEAAANANVMVAARTASNNERVSRQAATAKDIADERRRVIEAKAKIGAKEKAIEEARAAGLDTTGYQSELIMARADLEQASRALRLKLKVARLNPD